MTTFGEFKRKIIRLTGETITLNDNETEVVPIGSGDFDADLLRDSTNAALAAIATRQWKSALFTISSIGHTFELPSDLIEIDAVLDNGLNIFIPKLSFTLGGESSLADQGNSWIDTPQHWITFSNNLKSSGAKVYYSAAWPQPIANPLVLGSTVDDAVLEAPEFCLTALTLYAASYCFLRSAALQAKLGAFKTRVDSGNPEDIPARVVSDFLLKRFENEMTRIPMKQKGTQ